MLETLQKTEIEEIRDELACNVEVAEEEYIIAVTKLREVANEVSDTIDLGDVETIKELLFEIENARQEVESALSEREYRKERVEDFESEVL
jgi:hypothetical protein